jgi:hypothetical protein
MVRLKQPILRSFRLEYGDGHDSSSSDAINALGDRNTASLEDARTAVELWSPSK